MKKFFYATFVLISVVGLALMEIPFVSAQEDIDEFTLEEITVTAQKREENQQKVPIAMDVVSGEDLSIQGRDDIDEILKNVANVFINTASDGMRISLRGITDSDTTSDDQHVSGSTVAINIDGSYNNMNNAGQNLFDIERVEVLFGPQSTMYGANAPGGIVNIVTASPKTDKYSASATLEYGSYDFLNLQGMFNAPVYKDKLALRVSAYKSQQDSYVDPNAEANKTTSARIKALYQATDKLSFKVTGNWSKRGNAGMMGDTVVPFVDQDNVDDPWTPSEDSEGGNRDDQTTTGINANIDWETPIGAVAFVPSYSESESEGKQTRTGGGGPGGPPGGGEADEEPEVFYQTSSNTQKGAELRVTNAEDFEWFDWIVGGTWFESDQERYQDFEDPATLDTSRITTQVKKALYANITYPLWFNKDLRLTLGYRQSWDENTSFSVAEMMGGSSGNPEGYSKPDFKYGFEYDAADNLMFYGSYSSSYRSSNAMAMPDAEGNYPDPEELDAYTLGAKSRWFGNKLQVNASAYYYDYQNKLCSGWKESPEITESDLGGDYMGIGTDREGNPSAEYGADGQYPTLDPETGEPYVFTLHDPNSQGTGAFTSLGVDLQTSWIITSKDRLDFSIAYLNSEWKDLHFHYYWYMYFPDEDYEGVTPTNAPKWSMTASYEHTFTLGEYGTLTPRVDMQHKSSYKMVWNPTDKDPEGYGNQEPYYLWDASATYYHSSGKWSLNAYVKNITDYAVKRSYMGTMSFSMRIGDPRTYGLSLKFKF